MKVSDFILFTPNIKVSDLYGEHEYRMKFLPNNLQIDYDKYTIYW